MERNCAWLQYERDQLQYERQYERDQLQYERVHWQRQQHGWAQHGWAGSSHEIPMSPTPGSPREHDSSFTSESASYSPGEYKPRDESSASATSKMTRCQIKRMARKQQGATSKTMARKKRRNEAEKIGNDGVGPSAVVSTAGRGYDTFSGVKIYTVGSKDYGLEWPHKKGQDAVDGLNSVYEAFKKSNPDVDIHFAMDCSRFSPVADMKNDKRRMNHIGEHKRILHNIVSEKPARFKYWMKRFTEQLRMHRSAVAVGCLFVCGRGTKNSPACARVAKTVLKAEGITVFDTVHTSKHNWDGHDTRCDACAAVEGNIVNPPCREAHVVFKKISSL